MNSSDRAPQAGPRGRILWTCLCVGYVILILGTLTLARSLSRWGNRTLGFENLLLGVNGLYGLLLMAVLADLRRRRVAWTGLACVVGIAGIAATALTTIRLPEERIHFIEYIVLVSVAWKMFRTWAASRPVFAAFCMAVGVGILDETIQRFLPQRVFDWRDIGFNAFGALLGTGLLAVRILWAPRSGAEADGGDDPHDDSTRRPRSGAEADAYQ